MDLISALVSNPIFWIVFVTVFTTAAAFLFLRPKRVHDQNANLAARKEIEPAPELGVPLAPAADRAPIPLAPLPQQTATVSGALEKTKSSFLGRLKGIFSSGVQLGADELEQLEEVLYTSDLGPKTVQRLMGNVDERLKAASSRDFEAVRTALRDEMSVILSQVKRPELQWSKTADTIQVWMVVGVNGAGKTTTIGKLAHKLAQEGRRVMIAAGDTFRAAAGEQLKVWSERADVAIFSPAGVESPSAVAFDACKKAQTEGFDALIIDTAGRLHTQKHLMEELKKMKRVVEKAIPGAPHEVLLVLDANAGQNALIQAKEFHEALGVTGVILTKLDGTAKGGMAIGIACEVGLPIQLIGIGEKMEDLKAFSIPEFVDSIL